MGNKSQLPKPGKSRNPLTETRSNKLSPMRSRPKIMTNRAKGQ